MKKQELLNILLYNYEERDLLVSEIHRRMNELPDEIVEPHLILNEFRLKNKDFTMSASKMSQFIGLPYPTVPSV